MRTIRTLRLGEVETLVGWAAAEGWNPGVGDAAAFYAADSEGFLGAFVDYEMVAGISAVAYGTSFGFIGLYICRPDRRGHGHGKAVWDAGLAHLAGRTIGLDGVPEQQANYASMGFVKAYETTRMTGVFPVTEAEVTPVVPDMFAELAAFDGACFPEVRESFLQAWLTPPRRAFAVLGDGRIRGYGVVRACVEGHKIGPLFGETEDVAIRLLGALGREVGGPVQIDVPDGQKSFRRRLDDVGLIPGFSTARMYRGPAPQVNMARVFGISTLELG
jgi:hypothetical protein